MRILQALLNDIGESIVSYTRTENELKTSSNLLLSLIAEIASASRVSNVTSKYNRDLFHGNTGI
jgi:hypothetical protein